MSDRSDDYRRGTCTTLSHGRPTRFLWWHVTWCGEFGRMTRSGCVYAGVSVGCAPFVWQLVMCSSTMSRAGGYWLWMDQGWSGRSEAMEPITIIWMIKVRNRPLIQRSAADRHVQLGCFIAQQCSGVGLKLNIVWYLTMERLVITHQMSLLNGFNYRYDQLL